MTMAINQIVANLPAAPEGPPEQWSHSELLTEAAKAGLLQTLRFFQQHPITPEMSLRDAARVVAVAVPIAKLLAIVQTARLQQRADEHQVKRFNAAAAKFEAQMAEAEWMEQAERESRKLRPKPKNASEC